MPQTIIEHEFDFKETVILKTDRDKLIRMVVSMEISADSEPIYKVACGATTSSHYGYEMEKVNSDKATVGFSHSKHNSNGNGKY